MGLGWSSVAALAIAPLQDLLNLGKGTRMNVPGRAGWKLELALHRRDAFPRRVSMAAGFDGKLKALGRRRNCAQ